MLLYVHDPLYDETVCSAVVSIIQSKNTLCIRCVLCIVYCVLDAQQQSRRERIPGVTLCYLYPDRSL